MCVHCLVLTHSHFLFHRSWNASSTCWSSWLVSLRFRGVQTCSVTSKKLKLSLKSCCCVSGLLSDCVSSLQTFTAVRAGHGSGGHAPPTRLVRTVTLLTPCVRLAAGSRDFLGPSQKGQLECPWSRISDSESPQRSSPSLCFKYKMAANLNIYPSLSFKVLIFTLLSCESHQHTLSRMKLSITPVFVSTGESWMTRTGQTCVCSTLPSWSLWVTSLKKRLRVFSSFFFFFPKHFFFYQNPCCYAFHIGHLGKFGVHVT